MSLQLESTTSSEQFQKYLNLHKDQVRTSVAENYYPTNVVADAYSERFSAGEKEAKEDDELTGLVKQKLEEIIQKAIQVHLLTNRVVNYLKNKGHKVHSFYINVFHNNPKVVIAINNDLLLNDNFVEEIYTKVFEIKRIFDDLFHVDLDMGIMGSDGLDNQALIDDGYEYFEEII